MASHTLDKQALLEPLLSEQSLSDKEFIRYSAQVMLPELGEAGQLALRNAKVLLIGAGGLGAPVAAYLGAAGIGHLYLVDNDSVELSNLQRQIIYNQSQINTPKVIAAQQFLEQQNPFIEVSAIKQRFAINDEMSALVNDVDLVIDCTDNMKTRQRINAVCVAQKTALIVGAAVGFDGQLVMFDSKQEDSSCYHCLYPFNEDEGPQNCASLGVLGPIVGIIGALQGLEAVKYLAGMKVSSFNRLTRFDGRTLQSQHLIVDRDKACEICGKH